MAVWLNCFAVGKLSLQRQLALILVGMSVVFMVGNSVIQNEAVMPAFAALEREGAIRDINRCVAAVNRELELLGSLTSDWGAWDDTYQYVEDRNAKFAASNLTPEAFESARVSLLALVNNNKQLVWGEAYDLEKEERMEMPGLAAMLTNPAFPLIRHERVDDAKGGLLITAAGPLLLHSSPIITSKREGPIRGSVIMGRFLTRQEVQNLGERVEVDLEAWVAGRSFLGPDLGRVAEELRYADGPLVQVASSKSLLAYAKIDDIYGLPGLFLGVKVPREMTARGNFAAMLATWGGVFGSLAVMVGAGFLIRQRVVKPLEVIVAHAHHVGEVSDLKARLNSPRGDEIGQLSRALDEMVECLAVSRKKVLDAAHRAGMADVASEVLHNVGNVINSANSSVEQLEEQLRSSKVEGLAKAVGLLQENGGRLAEFFTQDPRGPKLTGYLVKIAAVLREEQAGNQERVSRIRKAMRHVQDIIALQEHRAHQGDSFTCETELDEVFRQVVMLNQDHLERAGIEVRVCAGPLLEIMVNRSKLIQVLVNLVRNAIQAMEGAAEGTRVLTLAGRQTGDGGIEIVVGDTGCGMAEEVRAKLFCHGFTTKENGQGIGLHYCANAMRTMGGRISASSEGPGRGASFAIWLPAAGATAGQPGELAQAA